MSDKLVYSKNAEEAMKNCRKIANSRGQYSCAQIHLLMSMLEIRPYCSAVKLINDMDIHLEHFTQRTRQALEDYKDPSIETNMKNRSHMLTRSLSNVFSTYGKEESEKCGDREIRTVHLFIAMFAHPDSYIQTIAREYGITVERIYKTQLEVAPSKEKMEAPAYTASEKDAVNISKYGLNLVEKMREKIQDPVIGRDNEIRDVINILSRKGKNNPVLIGEPGVGKTAVVEGLAQRIVKGDVPLSLQNKTIFALDLASMLSGCRYRGDFEERFKMVINEIVQSNGNTILFIDELHTIVGAGAVDGSSYDAANIIKPMLARGEVHCIGATTLDEYREYIEKDAALERRFQPVVVMEPSQEDAISILRGLKDKYEIFHGVKIMDNALVAAVRLSSRYICDRFLPDKAIDLVDETCARIKNELDSMPSELDNLARKMMQLEMEEAALRNEDDRNNVRRLAEIKKELGKTKESYYGKRAQWEAEKASVENVAQLKAEIETVEEDIETAQKKGDIETAASLRFVRLSELQRQLKVEEDSIKGAGAMLHDRVTEEEIRQTLEKWTGIPVANLNDDDKSRLLNLENELKGRVIGQQEAVSKVANAIKRSKAGIGNPNRPIGTFLFLGPTGVGKTELAKALSASLYSSRLSLVRIDMTEYMEKVSISRLIGASPGYVGYEEGGQLTEAVRRNPYCVVLFDEIEKAHPDIFNIMLQIFDDGRLTDSHGRTIDFKNTILIMTSNIAADEISSCLVEKTGTNNEIPDEVRKQVELRLKAKFKPEFLNRLDEKIIFKPLTENDMRLILKNFMNELCERLVDRDIRLIFQNRARKALVRDGYDPMYGARPLKRVLQENVENQLATLLISGEVKTGDTVIIDYVNGEYVVRLASDTDQERKDDLQVEDGE